MNINTQINIEKIHNINSQLELYKDAWSPSRLDAEITNLSKLLNDLESNTKKGFTHTSEEMRPQIINELKHLSKTIDTCGSKDNLEKIQTIKQKILNIEASVAAAPFLQETKISPKVVPIAFYSDITATDHNGAINGFFNKGFEQGLPSIVPRSVLTAMGSETDEFIRKFNKTESLLLKNQDQWQIYEKGEMLVFIPREFFPDKTDEERLQAFDLRTDGSLKKISVKEAMQAPKGPCDIQALFDLFVEEPKVNKLFYIAGHGNATHVAGLNEQEYTKVLSFLEPHCKVLTVTSCSSGGKSSLLNIPEKDLPQIENFQNQETPHSFHTIVRSINDFTVLAGQSAEANVMEYLQELSKFVDDTKAQTPANLRIIIEKVEGNKGKADRNLMQFYPAHSSGVPGGFRPIDEGGRGFSITYAMVQKAKIAPVIHDKRAEKLPQEPSITVSQGKILELHPLVLDVPITFVKNNPVLLSMTPGGGHHFIKALNLSKTETLIPLDYIKNTIDFYKDSNFRYGAKGFFIGEINSEKKFNDVAFYISPSGAKCVWREGDQYYLSHDGVKKDPISKLLHSIISAEIVGATRSTEKAIRATSAGQENEVLFQEAILEANFFDPYFLEIFNLTKTPLDAQLQCAPDFLSIIKDKTPEEKKHIVGFLLDRGNESLAIQLFVSENMDPNSKNIDGDSLLASAIKVKAPAMVKKLIDEGASVNMKNSLGAPPLHQVIEQLAALYDEQKKGIDNKKEIEKSEKILELLGQNSEINTRAIDDSGWSALVYAMRHPEIIEKLLSMSIYLSPNQLNDKESTHAGNTLLTFLIYRKSFEKIDLLLEHGADPNLGNTSALTKAVWSNDLETVKKFLKVGGRPFVLDGKGHVPFIEAIKRSTPAILSLFLEHEDCNLNVSDRFGFTPALAALVVVNDEKLQMLKSKNLSFPSDFNYKSEEILQSIIERFAKNNDLESMIKLMQINHSENLDYLVCQSLITKNPTLLKELIKERSIDLNAKNYGQTVFERLLSHAHSDFKDFEEHITLALTQGFDPLQMGMTGRTILEASLERGNVDVIRILLKHIDFSTLSDSHRYLEEIIKLNDLELVQLAVNKGANIHGGPDTGLLLEKVDLSSDSGKMIFKWLVEKGADLNAVGKNNSTPFSLAISTGDWELVKYCLDKGAKIINPTLSNAADLKNDPSGLIFKHLFSAAKGDINAKGGGHDATLFAQLVHSADLELIDWALAQGANVKPPLIEGQNSPLQAAAYRTHDPKGIVFKKFVALGASVHDLGFMPFAAIVKKGNLELVEFCFEQGIKFDTPEEHNELLNCAIESGNVRLFQLLLNIGYKITHLSFDKLLKGYDMGGPEILLEVLQKANIPDLDDQEKQKLWNLVVNKKDAESIELLFKKGISPLLSNGNNIVLQLAIDTNNLEVVNLLGKFKFPLSIEEMPSESAMNLINNNNFDLLECLLKNGMDPNSSIKTMRGSLLQLKMPTGQKDIIRLLLLSGANPRQTVWGQTSIAFAVSRRDLDLAKILLENGAAPDILIKNDSDKTALDLATDPAMVELLKSYISS